MMSKMHMHCWLTLVTDTHAMNIEHEQGGIIIWDRHLQVK